MDSRLEKMLNGLLSGENTDFKPQSRMEEYLYRCVNGQGVDGLPTPKSRADVLLYSLAKKLDTSLEGTGSEYYTLAPTALSFRSTEPIDEFQEVQINGETINSSDYTLTEGSTIVTLSVDYLKSLNTGDYEISIVSNKKTAKGNFSVKAPELNEYGFYYNQPYSAYVAAFGGNTVFFIRNDGTMDVIVIDNGYTEVATYTVIGDSMTVNAAAGAFTGVIANDGKSIYVNELFDNFILGSDVSIVADEDYLYIYKEELGGYEVAAIDRTKSEYGAIKTGINGIDTVKLADCMLERNTFMTVAPKILSTITSIGKYAFYYCESLTSITIPDSVTSIGECAFCECSSLTSVTIPNSVTSIEDGTFNGCTSLMSITIPESVTSIGRAAFSCSPLVTPSLKTVIFKDGSHLISIGSSAFSFQDFLKNIRLPDGLTTIEGFAFQGSGLTSVIIPNSVTFIGECTFDACYYLTNITFNGTIAEWNAISKQPKWNQGVPATHVHCLDGDVELD